MYYLQSRFYDPEICRFINADAQINLDAGFLGYNLFAYCNNNPINMVDPDGHELVSFGMLTLLGLGLAAAGAYLYYCISGAQDRVADSVKDMINTKDGVKNPKDNSVYVVKDSEENVKYVGRTNDPARREYERMY